MIPEPQDEHTQYPEDVEGADVRHLSSVGNSQTTAEATAAAKAAAEIPLPGAPAGDDGRSLEDMDDDEGTGQLPGMEQGSLPGDPDLTLAKITKGLPLQFENKMMGTSIGAPGGLTSPKDFGRAMVVYEVAKVELIPQREGEPGQKKLTGWIVRQHLRPTYTEPLEEALKDSGVTGAAA